PDSSSLHAPQSPRFPRLRRLQPSVVTSRLLSNFWLWSGCPFRWWVRKDVLVSSLRVGFGLVFRPLDGVVNPFMAPVMDVPDNAVVDVRISESIFHSFDGITLFRSVGV